MLMRWLKILLVLGGLIVSFLFPSLGAQATSTLPSNYQDKVIFHTPSHIAKFNKSSLKGLDPHVLVAFVGLMLVIIPGTFIYWGRRNQSKAQAVDSKGAANLDAPNSDIKKQIILNKISQLEEHFSQGKLKQEDYTMALKSYKALLKKMEEARG